MPRYILRRLLLMIPTLWAIVTLNFFIVQIAPGGPVDAIVAKMKGINSSAAMERIAGSGGGEVGGGAAGAGTAAKTGGSPYRGSRGLDPEVIAQIRKRFGFDKPILVRYLEMLKRYLILDFGDSLFKGRSVMGLVAAAMPVSITIGVWSTMIIYLVSIPLGIRKAVRHGSRFDLWTSTMVVLGNTIPTFLFAVLLIVLFAGGSFLKIFPLRGLVSSGFENLGFFARIGDYLWHIALPVISEVIGGFAALTMLTKNSFLDEVNKQYVLTARSKGLTERRILSKHVFRNAMLLVIAGFPSAFIGMFFTGSVLIEVIFSLNGLGLLGFEATMQRDYPVMFGTLYVFTLLGLLLGLLGDLTYTLVDPRIDFESRRT